MHPGVLQQRMVALPPLRDRGEDVIALAEHFVRKFGDVAAQPVNGFSKEVSEALLGFSFPGNVRQLENWIERAVVLAEGPILTPEDFPPQLIDAGQGPVSAPSQDREQADLESIDSGNGLSLDEQVITLEKRLIATSLARHGGNKSAVARELKHSERSIRYKIKKYEL